MLGTQEKARRLAGLSVRQGWGGISAVCCLIGKALNAVVVRQNYSRLVIDCNRTPGSGTSILDLSDELTHVPGTSA
jgi:predicted N-formylglutamate amidohydrolase